MIIEAGTEFGDKCEIVNHLKQTVRYVKSFNTETKEAEIYARFVVAVGDGVSTEPAFVGSIYIQWR